MWETTGQTGVCCDPDCQKGLHATLVAESRSHEHVGHGIPLRVLLPYLNLFGGLGHGCLKKLL